MLHARSSSIGVDVIRVLSRGLRAPAAAGACGAPHCRGPFGWRHLGPGLAARQALLGPHAGLTGPPGPRPRAPRHPPRGGYVAPRRIEHCVSERSARGAKEKNVVCGPRPWWEKQAWLSGLQGNVGQRPWRPAGSLVSLHTALVLVRQHPVRRWRVGVGDVDGLQQLFPMADVAVGTDSTTLRSVLALGAARSASRSRELFAFKPAGFKGQKEEEEEEVE